MLSKLCAVPLVLCAACTGYVEGEAPNGLSPTLPGGAATPNGAALAPNATPAAIARSGCSMPDGRGSARESLRRLTKGELVASLGDLLGAELLVQATAALAQIPEEPVLRTSKDLQPLHSQPFFDGYQAVVDALASAVAASPEARSRLGGACFAQDPLPADCAASFVQNFGRRAYRRPLSEAERTALVGSQSAFVRPGAPASDQVYGLMSQLLQAPEMLFHFEDGVADAPSRIRLTDYEVASRVAYSVLGGPPDVELAAAADARQLTTLAAVKAQVTRLLQTPRAQERFGEFFYGWLNMSDISRPSLAVGTWAGIDVTGMDQELRTELQDYLRYQVWEKSGDFRSLMTDTAVFPRSPRLAAVYGVSPVAVGTPPAQSSSHPGLLLRAGMIATSSIRTSIIRRGVFVLRRLLCDPIETPPTEIINMREEQVKGIDPTSLPNYEFVRRETSAATCMTCHQKINPVGYVFESFDQLGRVRSTEAALDAAGNVAAEHALPEGPFSLPLDPNAPISLPDAKALTEVLVSSDQARACLAANLLLHVERRQLEDSDCGGADVFERLKSGDSLANALAAAVANEDIFWRRPQ